MAKPAPESARPTRLDTRRREQAAFMLPVLGAALLLPPLIGLFDARQRLLGMPLETIYVFFVWLLLIAGAAVVSWRMPRADNQTPDASPDATRETDG
jgi:small-conductance mechanosensitive channel